MAKGNNKKKKFLIFGVLALLLIAVVVAVIINSNKEKVVAVQVEKVTRRTITQRVSATGNINPVDQVILRPEVNGEIVALPVEEGDFVKKGQLLVQIKPDIYIAQKKRAKANLDAAKAQLKVRKATLDQVEAEYKRVKGLFDKGLASQAELEKAKASFLQSQGSYEAQKSAVIQAEESLKEAEENLAKTEIDAPFDGTITALNVELSERVLGSSFSQGTHLMTIADLTNMEATVDVDENDVVLISLGDSADVKIDAFGDRTFRGVVTQIGNSAATVGQGSQEEVVNFKVKIKLLDLDKEMRPGMSCDAEIKTETKHNVLSVPIQSVTTRMPDFKKNFKNGKFKGRMPRGEKPDGKKPEKTNSQTKEKKPQEVVFVVKNGVAKMRRVKTGISDDAYIEIIKGLKEGERVVSGPYRAISKELEDGVKVIVQGNQSFKRKGIEN